NAAKAALNALTANARMELRGRYPQLHLSVVMPGVVRTDFWRNALGADPAGTPPFARASGGAPPAQTADEVADGVGELMERPVAEVYTTPWHAGLTERYYKDVDAFERERGT